MVNLPICIIYKFSLLSVFYMVLKGFDASESKNDVNF